MDIVVVTKQYEKDTRILSIKNVRLQCNALHTLSLNLADLIRLL